MTSDHTLILTTLSAVSMRVEVGYVLATVMVAAWAFDGPTSNELFNYNPMADPKATVVAGAARFTVLTSRVIRMEYSAAANAQFEDRATLAILNRKLPVPAFTQSTKTGVLTITTSDLELTYTVGQAFGQSSLRVQAAANSHLHGDLQTWQAGDNNAGNLLGTIKSLDMLGAISLNCTENNGTQVHDESLHCEWGLVSRAGWALVDDSTNWALTPGAEWWDSPNTNAVDWYFFGHGLDYRGALQDFTSIAGQIPMVPRYSMGLWWTRWYDLNNVDIRKVVDDYQSRGLPLDVFVLDMDWHRKNNWGGYTFDEHLFPYPADSLSALKTQGLRIAANLHDANGVGKYDAEFPAMCKALGLDPNTLTSIPFSMVNKSYVYALEDITLEAVIKQGMDFWWIDWQQGGAQGGLVGGKQNPTIWTDKIRVTDPKRQGKNQRGLVLARWGGLGTHRYQVGFSGDVLMLSWDNLAYQPFFSMTAANVGYGMWSHDIEGPGDNHEMYLRWVQWAAVSGIFRSHDRGMSAGACNDATLPLCSNIRVWELPTLYFEPARAAMTLRASLVPYLYTAVRAAFDTGLTPLRPMYYSFPRQNMAYAADGAGNFSQYFLGEDLIASPIVRPVDSPSNMATKAIWIPPGDWIEEQTGVLHQGAVGGSTVLTKQWDISEIPLFVRAGAIIPRTPVSVGDTIGLAQRAYTILQLDIYPGAVNGTTKIYEDDGLTFDYLNGSMAWTTVSYTRTASSLSLTVSTAGSYQDQPQARRYIINVHNALPVSRATADNVALQYTRFSVAAWNMDNTWRYDGNTMSLIAQTGPVDKTKTLQVNSFVLFEVAD